jgi:putative ABC transport system permease protein
MIDDPPRWRRALRFWGPDVEADVEDELRFHLESCAADLVARGHAPDEARRLAQARFGDVGRVRRWLQAHDRRRQRRLARIESMDAFLLDLRYALRKLRQQPAFSLSVVLVLALGIGAATTMFSAVDAALLRPLPFQRDDRLVVLDGVNIPTRGNTRPTSFYIDDARAMGDVFTHVAAYAPGGLNLAGSGMPARTRVALVTVDLFATLGVQPARGRGFTAEEGTLEGPRVAILSDGLWRRQFGGDPAVLGREVRLNEVPHRIVGIMPPRFGFPEDAELWLPLPVPNDFSRWEAFRQYMPSTVLARLAPGVTAAQAAARVHGAVQARRGEALDEPAAEFARPFRDVLVGNRRTALVVLMGATALVLLVACANATNLLLARATARRAEIALRAALGAGRLRIVRQLLVESLALAVAGGLLGVALAYASLDALGALMPKALAGTVPAHVDLRVLGFALALALATGLVFGLWPALGASRTNANETIKSAAAGAITREGARLRRAFVVAELALALTLAVGAGLMLRSFAALLDTDGGVRAEGVATLELALANARYANSEARRQFVVDLLARLERTPGVTTAAVLNELPMRGAGGVAYSIHREGRKPAPGDEPMFAQEMQVTADYFRTLGIPLLRGRVPRPTADSAAGEVVINQTLARRLWPGENPLGQRLGLMMAPSRTVVGVVGDVRIQSLDDDEIIPQMYVPLTEQAAADLAVVARGALPPSKLGGLLREAVRAVDQDQAVYNVRPMDEVIAGAIAPRRVNTLLITIFGLVAVALAAVGVYGVVAYGVARRAREIGIRVALGATARDVLGLVLREGLALAAAGLALGLAGAWALRRVLESLLYGVAPDDPAAFAGAAAVLVVIALVATLLPARQALRVDPARTMRVE